MSEEDAPESAAEPRPNGEPYYIDEDCPDCGASLVLNDKLKGRSGDIWHDEWACPDCDNGIFMDWPEEQFEHLKEKFEVESEFVELKGDE